MVGEDFSLLIIGARQELWQTYWKVCIWALDLQRFKRWHRLVLFPERLLLSSRIHVFSLLINN